jgi:hypothetical protein
VKAVVLGVLLAFVAMGAAQAAPTANIKIAATFWDLVSAGDVAGAMAYVDPQAEFRSSGDVYSGPAQIQPVLEGYVAAGYKFHMTHLVDDGTGRIAYWYEVYDKAGTSTVSYGLDGLTIVRGGHLVFDGTTANVPAKFMK